MSNAQQARVQLQYLRLPVEVFHGDNVMTTQQTSLQLPQQPEQNISATKQAFLDMASGPVLDLDAFENDSADDFCDSDPEILLSDSDEEEEGENMIDECQVADAETAIGSEEDFVDSDEESMDMDVFDEHTFAPKK